MAGESSDSPAADMIEATGAADDAAEVAGDQGGDDAGEEHQR